MRALELKIPPAVLVLLTAALMWLIDQGWPGFRISGTWSQWASLGLSGLALLCVVAGVIGFQRAQTTVDPTRPERASSVVTSGIFRYTRNPMYLGFALLISAFACKLANPLTAVMVPLFVAYLTRFQIQPEEAALSERFGQQYLDYQLQVRRWL
ncbi:methyltransferase family protein [Marinicella meishanensis]|uniref:methyltransferase family protein n=1 Tax=Marinicella meishanensis TaxID=2873263 RepID=UPI001CBC6B8D|nr:isoprenylcysteine carboxylmethyltransferase family protein [Marinicella sp. NBU2979]